MTHTEKLFYFVVGVCILSLIGAVSLTGGAQIASLVLAGYGLFGIGRYSTELQFNKAVRDGKILIIGGKDDDE